MNKDVYLLEDKGITLLVIEVPRADYTNRPVFIGENPLKGTYKRNYEGDYHAKEYEVLAMLRDKKDKGNDGLVLDGYTLKDIDLKTLKNYRVMFENKNPEHVWCSLENKAFLEVLGAYKKEKTTKKEGLTTAGLLMFGTGIAIREKFDNLFMDYLDET